MTITCPANEWSSSYICSSLPNPGATLAGRPETSTPAADQAASGTAASVVVANTTEFGQGGDSDDVLGNACGCLHGDCLPSGRCACHLEWMGPMCELHVSKV